MFDKKETVILSVEEMHCSHCTARVEKALLSEKGVKSAEANLEEKNCTVIYIPSKITPEKMCEILAAMGFPAKLEK